MNQNQNLRQIQDADVPELFTVRVATHENALTREELTSMGITEESVKEKLDGSFRGWLFEIDTQVVGFAIGDGSTGELRGIAVLPEFIGHGIGSALLRKVEDWLQSIECTQLWLTTDSDPGLEGRSHQPRCALHGQDEIGQAGIK